MRFRVRSMLVAMAALAVICAAWSSESMVWASLFLIATRMWLVAALILLIASAGHARAYWVGVLIAGLGFHLNSEFLRSGGESWDYRLDGPLTELHEWAFNAIQGGHQAETDSTLVLFCTANVLISLAGSSLASWAYARRGDDSTESESMPRE